MNIFENSLALNWRSYEQKYSGLYFLDTVYKPPDQEADYIAYHREQTAKSESTPGTDNKQQRASIGHRKNHKMVLLLSITLTFRRCDGG